MIQVLGTSHNIAPLEIREKFSFASNEIDQLAQKVINEGIINELVVVSTCNRSEFYFTQTSESKDDAFRYLFGEVCKVKGLPGDDFDAFYHFTEEDAVKHLFSVSAGIDSMILGEDQIIGQIKDAYLYCTNKGYTDAILMRLFQKAFEAGKRVRSETEIRLGTTAISYLAIDLCKQHFDNLSDKQIMVIGAGDAGRMIINRLKKMNTGRILVANRTSEKAIQLLDDYEGAAIGLDEISANLAKSDVVIAAAGSPEILVRKQDIENLPAKAENPARLFIDISVPQSIEQPDGDIDGIHTYTVDDMKELAVRNAEKRKASLGPAQDIIREVAAEYMEWLASRSLRPVIQTITANLQQFSENELSDFRKSGSADMNGTLEHYNAHLTQKYIRLFIKNLKAMSDGQSQKNYVELVNSLFKIS